MGNMKQTAKKLPKTFFFEDKPLFGMDIGYDTLRVMQLEPGRKKPRLKGYGSIQFDPRAIANGVIVRPELIAKVALHLFGKELIGDIGTKRVAVSLPASYALTHALRLPLLGAKDIAEAVQTEVEQLIPAHADSHYLDYTIFSQDEEGIEVFVVAMPKTIVDSYLVLTRMMGLEAVAFDTTIGASAHLFAQDSQSNIPAVLVDFGSENTDITVFNHGLVVTGAVAFGGDDITATIAKKLGISMAQALVFKSKYGLSVSNVQKQIVAELEPSLDLLLKEIRRTIRYYEQRYSQESPIGQVVIMGGGANMPGMADFLISRLRLPVRTIDPTTHIAFGHLHPFYTADRTSYVTVAGLATMNPMEIFS